MMSDGNSFFLFVVAMLCVLFVDRKNFRREGLLLLRRTRFGVPEVNRFGARHKLFFTLFGDLGTILGFGSLGLWFLLYSDRKNQSNESAKASRIRILKQLAGSLLIFGAASLLFKPLFAAITGLFGLSGFITAFLFMGAKSVLTDAVPTPAVAPVIPGVRIPGAPIFVPLGYGLIAMLVLLVAHEISHAFVSRSQGVKVKSLGYGFFGIIPVGFAEPDEAALKSSKPVKQVRVFAAGSLANVAVTVIAMVLTAGLIQAYPLFFDSAGVAYESTTEGMPAHGLLPFSGVITHVNGNATMDLDSMAAVMSAVKPNDTITLNVTPNPGENAGGDAVTKGSESYKIYDLKVTGDPDNSSRAFIGLANLTTKLEMKESIGARHEELWLFLFPFLYQVLLWVRVLNLGVGLANMMPLSVLDGGLMADQIMRALFPKKGLEVYSAISGVVFCLLVINLLGPYVPMRLY